jgi:hypothetical protein
VLLAATALLGACSQGTSPPQGQLQVVVTLSRSGGAVGPTFDHAPQSGEVVRVADSAGRDLTATTDSNGRASLDLPPGDYGVTADFCPNGPVEVHVSADEVSEVAVDCLAP